MKKRLLFLFISSMALLPQLLFGQQHPAAADGYISQERIYLQTDKPYYAAGDTIWFRVHLTDAATNTPASRSRFVYVELHDQDADTLMQRIMVRCDEDGVFANALLLPKTMKGGVYTLAAYTQWMRNFPPEQFCYKPLIIAGGKRVRGHHIPEDILSEYGAAISISGKASTGRAPMTLNINVRDKAGKPLNGIYALSVTDYDVVKPDSIFGDIRQSLLRQQLSYLPDTLPAFIFPYQEEQLITGRIKGTLRSKIKNPHLLVVNSRTGQQHEFELGDSTRFALAVDNPEGTTFLLEGTRRTGSTSFVELQVDEQTFPKLKLPHYTLASDTSNLSAFMAQAQEQQQNTLASSIELPEIKKIGKKRKPLKSNFMGLEAPKGYAEDDPRLERAVTMQQLLLPFGIWVRYQDGYPYITTADNSGVLIYVDNIREGDYDYVLNLLPTDIKSIEYFTPNNAINGLFGARPASNSGKVPGVLHIFLKDGSEVLRKRSSPPLSMCTVRQLGYRMPIEFYSPQYTSGGSDLRSDMRTTLYWNPKVRADAGGEATVTFFASDVSKRYLVTIEGVSDNGTVVHHQQIIE